MKIRYIILILILTMHLTSKKRWRD